MNSSYCLPIDDNLYIIWMGLIQLAILIISVLVCLATVVLVCKHKLYKILFYRLAMYQVLSAMEFSIVWIVAVVTIVIPRVPIPTIDALLLGSSFMKLMFTFWISIHLFALAVFHKNLQRLEALYVVSSLLAALVVTAVLLCKRLLDVHNYNWCDEGYLIILIFAVLTLVSLLMVVMGIILCYRACRRRNAIHSEYDKQHKKALCEMLPLLLYPILFLLFTTPIFSAAVYQFVLNPPDRWRFNMPYFGTSFMFGIFAPLWSFTTSLLLIFHLCGVRFIRNKKAAHIRNGLQRAGQQYKAEEGSVTIKETTRLCQKSYTHFSAPIED